MPLQLLNEALRERYDGTPIVCGSGPVPCDIMLIGEAPGAKEIESGVPFCGPAGSNLNKFLESLGLRRSDVYITNVCKFRPTKVREGKRTTVSNRTPTAAEIREAVRYLTDEIEVVDPKMIILLGNTPLRAVTGRKDIAIGDVHGTCLSAEHLADRCLFALYHPASLIYNRALRETYEADIESLRSALRQRGLLRE